VVERVVDRLIVREDVILFGDAPNGVDRMVAEYVYHMADHVRDWQEYPAEWERYGKRAGHLRNEWMVHDADALIAIFADGTRTPGTSNAVMQARRKGIPVAIYHEGVWEGSLG
jgi:hypothetical protein